MEYRWNEYQLDAKQYRLYQNGDEVTVEPQVFDLLVYLIENRDRLVTREELLDKLWEGKVVSDSALNSRLKGVRKAVGDSGKQQSTIKTTHGRGYQFIAHIVGSGEKENKRSGGDVEYKNIADSGRSVPSLGIVRFSNLSNDPEQQYFSDGISTNIWSGLARIRSLIVKSALNHDHHSVSLESVASKLEVNYLLTGSVQRENEHVRVFAELIDCVSGETMWSEKYDRFGAGVIAIQDDIARAIIATLWTSFQGKIREIEFDHLSRKTARDFNAFDFILKGIAAKEKYTKEGNLEGHYYLNQAKSLEPDNPEVFAWSAVIHMMDIYLGFTDDFMHSRKQACSEASQAISLDRDSEMGHWALALCHSEEGDSKKAIAEFNIALEINPNNPDTMVCKGSQLVLDGCVEEGIELCLQGIRFSRNYPEWYLWEIGIAYFASEQFDEAVDSFNGMKEKNADVRIFLCASYAIKGRLEKASACLQEIFREDPKFSVEQISQTHRYLPEESFRNLRRGLQAAFQARTDKIVVRIDR